MKDICYICGELFADINCSLVVCVHQTIVELIKAADSLVRALVAPEQSASEPSKAALDAFGVVNQQLVASVYDLLIYKLKDQHVNAPAGEIVRLSMGQTPQL